MGRSRIEWCDYTINPIKGLCPVACSYCYARRMYKRFHWNPNIRADWQQTGKIPNRPARIFVGSTMELFGDWIKSEWMQEIMAMPKRYPQHTFIFLTKKPENLIKWSPFPDNCWVGVSATNINMAFAGGIYLGRIQAKVKFLSLEPLLSWDTYGVNRIEPKYFSDVWKSEGINWIIIGQQTPISSKTMPTIQSITQIMTAADKANVPIFLKNNLSGFLPFRQHYKDDYHNKCYTLRQEFPVVSVIARRDK